MQNAPRLSVWPPRVHGIAIFLVASATTLLLLAAPRICNASTSQLVWGDRVWDDITGEIVSDDRIYMEDDGTYPVTLHVSKDVYVARSEPGVSFDASGVLFRVPDPQSPTRELVGSIGGFFGANTLVWEIPGVYELDVYNVPPPVMANRNPNNSFLRFLFGRTAHAQLAEDYIETIRFTVTDAAAPTAYTPVVIIPGILGSAQHNGEWLIDPITHAYDNLIDTLDANGYEKGVTLFPFPYDWRVSNRETAFLLKQKIDEIKIICGCDKVDVVAHSMGGLVARQYIQSDDYGHDVRKLIFLGTPHLGAPKTYLMWEGGESDIDKSGQQLKYFLLTEALKHGFSNLFDYIHTTPVPSVQELLPVYGYIKHSGSPDIPSFPNSQWYPNNLFLSDLNSSITDLYNSGVTISNFVGQTADDTTISTIRVVPPTVASPVALWGFGKPENFGNSSTDQGLERGAGDGTVPLSSAALIISDIHIIDSEHNKLPTEAEGDVFEKLTGIIAPTLVTGKDRLDIPMLIFQILSPADIVVVAPDGLKIGKDFVTGNEFNQIPDAFYSGFGTDEEYITIPNPLDGVYKVITQGTGSGGSYTIATGMIGDATSSETFFTGQTLPDLITEISVDVDPEQPDQTTITPVDQTPPTVTIVQPASATYTRSDMLLIRVTFSDATGVASSSVAFDATGVAASSTTDLFFQTLGNHTVSAYAMDLVNNATTSKRVIQVIATANSTRNDINRAFSLGWIKSAGIKASLTTLLALAQQQKRPSDKNKIYKSMLGILNGAKKTGIINQQGYELLVADINWLINH